MTIVGVATLLIGAYVFAELQSALDTVFDVNPDQTRADPWAIRDRILSFSSFAAGSCYWCHWPSARSLSPERLAGRTFTQWSWRLLVGNQYCFSADGSPLRVHIQSLTRWPAWSDVWHGPSSLLDYSHLQVSHRTLARPPPAYGAARLCICVDLLLDPDSAAGSRVHAGVRGEAGLRLDSRQTQASSVAPPTESSTNGTRLRCPQS